MMTGDGSVESGRYGRLFLRRHLPPHIEQVIALGKPDCHHATSNECRCAECHSSCNASCLARLHSENPRLSSHQTTVANRNVHLLAPSKSLMSQLPSPSHIEPSSKAGVSHLKEYPEASVLSLACPSPAYVHLASTMGSRLRKGSFRTQRTPPR